MRNWVTCAAPALALMLSACGGGGDATSANIAASEGNQATSDVAAAEPKLPACPFRETEWKASVTAGELLVNGTVDVMMAGFEPTLTRREGSPGSYAFDLALVPTPGAAVNDRVRYEESGVAGRSRAEIYCGGERIAAVDVVLVG